MRAYIYQARDILGLDSEGVSDAYAHVCFQNVSAPTRVIKETLCPDWDQTLVFEEMSLFGSPAVIAENPPLVFIELYDKDKVVSMMDWWSFFSRISKIKFRILDRWLYI